MKTLITTVAILAISLNLKAQDGLLGKSSSYIKGAMLSIKNTLIADSGKTVNYNERYYSYKISNDYEYTFYFSSHADSCLAFNEYLSKKLLFTSISYLNSKYNKVDDNNWISKDNNYRVTYEMKQDTVVLTHTKL